MAKYMIQQLSGNKPVGKPRKVTLGKHDGLKGYDPKELKMGQKVEKEHTDDPDISTSISKDHLDEMRKYYTHLKIMEDNKGCVNKKVASALLKIIVR